MPEQTRVPKVKSPGGWLFEVHQLVAFPPQDTPSGPGPLDQLHTEMYKTITSRELTARRRS